MAYVCETVDVNNVCQSWVQVLPFGLPSLSIQDATAIGGGIVLTWVIAFGFVLVGRMLLNR